MLSRDSYQQATRRAAQSVAVVTTTTRQGHDFAVTVTDYLSISYDPPTMLVSLYGLGRMAEILADAGIGASWALNVLNEDQGWLAERFANGNLPLAGVLDQVPHSYHNRTAWLTDSLVNYSLSTIRFVEQATHLLVIGEVTGFQVAEDPKLLQKRPLLYYQNQIGGH